MATTRRSRGIDIVNPIGRAFSDFYGNPLPSDTSDIEKWAQELLAVLDTNFNKLSQSIEGTGHDLQELEAGVVAEAVFDAANAFRAAEGYRDNFANLTAAATGGGNPSLQPFGPSGNVKQRRFGIGDSVYVVWHIDHDIKPGSTCFMHVHWSSDGTDLDPVAWEINYTFASRDAGDSGDYFPSDTTITIEDSSDGTAWRHKVSEDPVGIIVPSVDSLVIGEVKRVAPSTGTNSDDIFGLFVDIHYVSDRIATPNSAPDFYN